VWWGHLVASLTPDGVSETFEAMLIQGGKGGNDA
jgi:hypothetical protein